MKNSREKAGMHTGIIILTLLSIFFINIFLIPAAGAQLEIKNYSATYQLEENGMNVTEVILFSNPENSSVHTYDRDVILKRSGADYESISVSGINSKTENGFIYLKFSKDWLIKGNKREVRISYFIPVSGELKTKENVRIYSFHGRLLPELPVALANAVVAFITPENFEFSIVSFPAEKRRIGNREVLIYVLSPELIKLNPLIEFEYGNFKESSENLASLAEKNLGNAKENIESTERKLALAARYNLSFSEIEMKINESREYVKSAENEIAEYRLFSENNDFYNAYRHADNAYNLSILAKQFSEEAEIAFSLNLEARLREKIFEIGNLSEKKAKEEENITIPEKKEEEKSEKPEVKKKQKNVSANLTSAANISKSIEKSEKKAGGKIGSAFIYAFLLIAFLLLAVFIAFNFLVKKKEEEMEKKEDLSAISVIKRQRFADFEKKLESVRSDAEIADEIVKLRKQKEKLKAEIKELERRLKKYEITEETFTEEKRAIEKKIGELDIRIGELEEEIKSK